MKTSINITILVVGALLLNSCNEDDKFSADNNPPVVNLDVTSFPSVNFNDSVVISGNAASPNAIRDISFFLVKKNGAEYERLWFSPVQYAAVTISKDVEFSKKVKVNDPEAEAIAVSVNDPYGNNTINYIPIQNIIGSPAGSASVLKSLEMTAEYEYGSSAPYVFSLKGIHIGGVKKNILSLNEIKNNPTPSLDFAFVNIWRNTTKHDAGVLGNWGYALCEFRQLSKGSVGRQCDYITLTGNEEIPAGIDTCSLVIVPASVANSNNFNQVMENASDNYGTYNFLNLLAPLFKTDQSQYIVNFKTNAASTTANSINTAACVTSVTASTYVAFRRLKNGAPSYGLIQIKELPTLPASVLAPNGGGKYMPEPYPNNEISNANLPKKWYENAQVNATGIAVLYGKSIKINVIAQQ